MTREYDTILEFDGDVVRLFASICEANKNGCDVVFKNEGIVFGAEKESAEKEMQKNMLAVLYCTIWKSPDIIRNYINALLLMKEKRCIKL